MSRFQTMSDADVLDFARSGHAYNRSREQLSMTMRRVIDYDRRVGGARIEYSQPQADRIALEGIVDITAPILHAMRATAILEAAAMPTWEQCKNKHDSGERMSSLETLIYFYENAGHESAELFRESLRLLLTDLINAATAPYME